MKLLLTFFTTLFVSPFALANFTYEGTLVDPSGNPVTGSVAFTLKIKSPTPSSCLLYTETHTISMTNADGYFSLVVGAGNGVGNTYDFNRIFQNRGMLTGLTCGSGSTYYSAALGDVRMMEVTINPNGNGNVILGTLSLQAVPLADSARSVNGFEVTNLLRAVDAGGEPMPGLALNPPQITELLALANGTSTNYVAKSATTGSSAQSFSGSPSSPTAGTFWYDSTMGKMRYFNGTVAVDMGSTGGTVTGVGAGVGLTGGMITTTGTLSVDVGTGPNKIPQLDAAGKLPISVVQTGTAANQIPLLDGAGKLPSVVIPTGTGPYMIPELDVMGKLSMSVIPNSIMDAMWTISGPHRYVNTGGNVGIGTSSPTAALDVQGGASVVAVFGAPTLPNAGISFMNNSTMGPYPFLGMMMNDLVYRRDGGVEALRISGTGMNYLAGKLGINSQSPQGVLDVASETGSIPNNINFKRTYNDMTSINLNLLKARGTMGMPTVVQNGDFLMNITSQGFDGSAYTSATFISSAVDGTPSGGSIPGALIFGTASSGVLNERMRISAVGNVGIGINNPGYALHVNGVVAGTAAYQNLSDRRYKKNIHTLNSSLAKILSLRGVGFDWRQDEFPSMKFTPGHDIGFIAQEIEQVYPEAVMTDSEGYKTVAYSKLISPLVESTKELYQVCASQEEKVVTMQRGLASVEEENRNLKAKNEAIQSENQVIKAYLCAKDPSAPFCK